MLCTILYNLAGFQKGMRKSAFRVVLVLILALFLVGCELEAIDLGSIGELTEAEGLEGLAETDFVEAEADLLKGEALPEGLATKIKLRPSVFGPDEFFIEEGSYRYPIAYLVDDNTAVSMLNGIEFKLPGDVFTIRDNVVELRTGPGIRYSVQARVYRGDLLLEMKRMDGWASVTTLDYQRYGFVPLSLLALPRFVSSSSIMYPKNSLSITDATPYYGVLKSVRGKSITLNPGETATDSWAVSERETTEDFPLVMLFYSDKSDANYAGAATGTFVVRNGDSRTWIVDRVVAPDGTTEDFSGSQAGFYPTKVDIETRPLRAFATRSPLSIEIVNGTFFDVDVSLNGTSVSKLHGGEAYIADKWPLSYAMHLQVGVVFFQNQRYVGSWHSQDYVVDGSKAQTIQHILTGRDINGY